MLSSDRPHDLEDPFAPSDEDRREPEAAPETAQELVRRVDHDRWMAARFAEKLVSDRLAVLYSFAYEISRIPEAVADPTLGQIRLQFWRDCTPFIFGDAVMPSHHPVAEAMEALAATIGLDRVCIEKLIDARTLDFETAPFKTWQDLEAYVDATAGGLARLAAQICAPGVALTGPLDGLLRSAGRAWAYVGLLRAQHIWTHRRRTFFPQVALERLGLAPDELFAGQKTHEIAAAGRMVLERARAAHGDAKRLCYGVAKELFPAYGYVALLHEYIHELETRRPLRLSLLRRQLRLVFAASTGRV